MGIANFLLDENKIVEGMDEFSELFSAIRAAKPELNGVEDRVINNILTIYTRDVDISKKDVDPDEFVDWFNLFDTFGEFIFDYRNELALKNLEDLGALDPQFLGAATEYAKKYGYVDNDGRDIANVENEAGKVLSPKELMRSILDDACRSSSPEERENNEDHFDDELFNDTIDELSDIYHGSDIKEELEETIDVGEVPPAIENTPVAEPAAELEPEQPSEEVIVSAHNDMIQSLINSCWSFITEANGVIATLEFNNAAVGDVESVKELLNDVVDQTTINIGILHKVATMVDSNTAELIATGENKAEQKLGN